MNKLIAATTVLCFSILSCKKNNKTTSDFRDAYIGKFSVMQTNIHKQHPSSGGTSRNVTTAYDTIVVSYTITDSLTQALPSGHVTYAAMRFLSNKGATEMIGIAPNGNLFRADYYSGNSGGYVGTDSILHVWTNGGVSFDDSVVLTGHKMP